MPIPQNWVIYFLVFPNHRGITALPCVLSNSTNSNYRTEMGVGFLGFQSKNLTKKGRPEHRSILKTARSWTFLSSKEPSSKPLVIIKAAPLSLPCRGGSARGAGRGLQEGFHIWLNYEPFAV